MKKSDDYIALNKHAWEQAEPIHREARFDQLKKSFLNPDFIYLNGPALRIFQKTGLQGKSVIHLMCNNGREVISLKRMGAERCAGVDFSQGFITQAIELANLSNSNCEFISCDVLKIPESYYGEFNIVFISSGSFRWMPELDELFNMVRKLLAPGGMMVITEMHPILNTLEYNPQIKDDPVVRHSYFRAGAIETTDGLNYWQNKKYGSPPVYHFQHTLGEIFTQCFSHGMGIRHFSEHQVDLSGGYYSGLGKTGFPLSFSLVAILRKQ